MLASTSEMVPVGSAAQAQHRQSRTCSLQLGVANPSCSRRMRRNGVGAAPSASPVLSSLSRRQRYLLPRWELMTVLVCSGDTVTIPALPAAPCGFCALLSCVKQMIYIDAGPPGDALWLVAYGKLWTPLATVALSLTQLQGTDPAGASQLRFPGSPCLDISDVEIKEPVFIHRTGNTHWKGCRHKVLSSSALSA